MIAEGAAIIDIGGASSRPGAKELSIETEWQRLEAVLTHIRKEYDSICISVDTYHGEIAERAIGLGADMINDISGGTYDPAMAKIIGKNKLPYVMMHMQGMPGNMQDNPQYDDVVEDIMSFFQKQTEVFREHGAEQLILDPGFGFGKNVTHNYSLLNNLRRFEALKFPLLVGVSRKSMINRVLGIKAEEALNGTSILNTIALLNGAKILRVHDVKEAVEAIKLVEKVQGSGNQVPGKF
jgi:dihydropteroate synthase